METVKTALLRGYIQVRRAATGEFTYGGDQTFFAQNSPTKMSGQNKQSKTDVSDQNKQSSTDVQNDQLVGKKKKQRFQHLSEDEKKHRMGCGIVALGDIFLYIAGENNRRFYIDEKRYVNRRMDQEEYCEYYNIIYRFVGRITKNGISGLKLWRKFNQMARKQGWKERAFWGMSIRKMFARMEEMLGRDLPVILCIPMTLFKKDKDRKLSFYKRDEKGQYTISTSTSGHYVVVTGIFYEDEEAYLVISSWGKQYFVKWREYEHLVRTQFLGAVLGNLLYIQ